MPSTVTLLNSINWLSALIEQQPVLVNGMEPALSSATLVKQVLLGAPIAWPWNRSSIDYTTNSQDTNIANLNDFGFLEGGSVQVDDDPPMALQIKNVMEVDQTAGSRPQFVSPWLDDGYGNITFRLIPSPDPDSTTNVNLFYQRSAPPMLSLASLWTPIPDDLVYMPHWGILSMMSLIGNDGRFNEYNAKFITSVLSANGGLSDMEKAIFASNWSRALSYMQSQQLSVSERYRARES